MDPLYTTHDIAQLIQVDTSTVSKWIDKALLPAFRTPGGHRRVRRSDLKAFLQAHGMPVPRELDDSRRLLVVDDETAATRALARVLKRIAPHVTVMEAGSGAEGILLIAEEKPDAALIDLNLGEVDGLEVCRAVRARESLRSVALVVMAMNATPAMAVNARKAGAIDCLKKPVNPEALLQALGVASEGRATESQAR